MKNLINGACTGVFIDERGMDKDLMLTLAIEDDELWHKKDFVIHSYWIDDLINVLQRTKRVLEDHADLNPNGFGYITREREK